MADNIAKDHELGMLLPEPGERVKNLQKNRFYKYRKNKTSQDI